MPSCGITDPGTLATASRKSSTSAVRIEVSCRHPHRNQPATVRRAPGGEAGRTLLPSPAAAVPPAPKPSPGTPSSGTPSSGTPSSGTPSSGTPWSGTPSTGRAAPGTPATETPPPGTPPPGTPPPGTPPPGRASPGTVSGRPEPDGARSLVIGSPSTGTLSCGLRGHFGDQLAQRRVTHLTDDPRGNPPRPADHQRGGDPGRRDRALEGERYLVTRVVQARVADLEIPLESGGG